MTEHERLLMEAGGHLAKAIRALQDANEAALLDRALTLSNDVLRLRREQRQVAGAR